MREKGEEEEWGKINRREGVRGGRFLGKRGAERK